jgi:multiple antibiotic resistance protein
MEEAIGAFLLGFPAMLSIAHPIGGAFAFAALTDTFSPAQRERVALLVGFYTLVLTLVALWTGSFVLGFFSITLPAVRIAGGLMIAISAWDLLRGADAPDEAEARASNRHDASDVALVPLTMPLTAGPGMIMVAVALGSEHPDKGDQAHDELAFFIGLSLAAIAMSIAIWQIFRASQWIIRLVTPSGLRTVNRLIGFLLLCIGIQIMATGVEGVLRPLLAAR